MSWEKSAFLKLAGKGAIVFLPTSNGKYLMQDDPACGLRPPGGHKEREDKDMLETILREIEEEFGIPQDKVESKIKLLGYEYRKPFWGNQVFEFRGHGLKPGLYQASNSPDEKVKLVEVDLDHPKYVGPLPFKLITPEAKKYGDRMFAAEKKSHEKESVESQNAKASTAAGAQDAQPVSTFDDEVGLPGAHRLKQSSKDYEQYCDFGSNAIGAWLGDHPEVDGDDFTDFVEVHNRADRDSGELQDVSKDEIDRLGKQFLADRPPTTFNYKDRLAKLKARRDPDGIEAPIDPAYLELFRFNMLVHRPSKNSSRQSNQQLYVNAQSPESDRKEAGKNAETKTASTLATPSAPTVGTETAPRTGPEAIAQALRNIDLDKLEEEQHSILFQKKKSKRPDAVKILGFIQGFRRAGMHPKDLLISKVPVIPPQFRPYSIAGDTFVPGDANELYRDLINMKDLHGQLAAKLGPSGEAANRLRVYDSVKALYGYGDPVSPKTRERGVSGFLQKVVGTSPKFSFVQRKLLSKDQDFVGRGVIGVDPELGLDQIGLPDEMLWKIYSPYIQRRLVRGGMTAEESVRHIRDQSEHASRQLDAEIKERPVIYSRAPSWHKFNVIAGYPKRIPGNTIMINPLVTTGMTADFDGDQINVHVPAMHDSVDDAKEKLMPSKMLFSIKDRTKVVPTPKQESVLGVYQAQHRPARNTHIFPDEKSALAAIQTGKVKMSDEVHIGAPTV